MLRVQGGRLMVAAVMSAVLAVGVSACGSDSSSSSSAPSVDESVLGSVNKATGTPVTLGFISDGKSQFLDNSDEIKAARAAVEYTNNYRGGIGGHPVQLKVCETRLVPSAGTDCANQMVAAKVAAVIEGASATADSTLDPLVAAKIPLFMHTSTTQKTFSTPGVFSFFNGLSVFGIAATQAKNADVKRVAVVVIGVPAAEGAAQGAGKLVFGNAGIETDIISVPPGTADATPQITAANRNKPGLYMVMGDDAFCPSVLKPIKTIAPDAKISIIDRCIGPAGGKSIPNGFSGMESSTTISTDATSPDGKLISAALAKYGDGSKFTATSGYGWSPTLALITALNAAKVTDVTPATVLAGMQAAPALPYPLASGVTFQCNGKQVAVSPFICGSGGQAATPNKSGKLSDFRAVQLDPKLFALPSS